jgi:hypothetical protein
MDNRREQLPPAVCLLRLCGGIGNLRPETDPVRARQTRPR